MQLAITVCATARYCYAMRAQARHVVANLREHPAGVVIFATDQSPEAAAIEKYWKEVLPEGWAFEAIRLGNGKLPDTHANYQNDAQLLIAQLRTAAFTRARRLRAALCWSLDSDVLPPPNALRCMLDMLRFDGGYYSVSTCTYPSQGGGGFLGGRGSPQRQIASDFYDDERTIPDELKARMEAHEKAMQALAPGASPSPELVAAGKAIRAEVEKCPPRGNVFALNAERWRPRGWLDNAYPALGQGAILPSDWCGFGCTLMNAAALDLAHFEGYAGHGTEDLFIVWERWHRAGLRLNVIPHAPCAHVVRAKDATGKTLEGKYVLCQPYHETEGECRGHLRLRHLPWYAHEPGERYTEANDGRLQLPA